MSNLTGGDGPPGDDGVFPSGNGKNGIGGGTVVSIANVKTISATNINTGAGAFGGNGGHGGNGADAGYDAAGVLWSAGSAGSGGPGGNGYATATATTTNNAYATSTGGYGGASGLPGAGLDTMLMGFGNKGGAGGFASARTTNYNSLIFATSTSSARAGNGGAAHGVGKVGGVGGGAGGTVSPSIAEAGEGTLGGAATAIMSQIAGAGGAGLDGASGGAGAVSTSINAVKGYSNGGVLTLSQTAIGGAGGDSTSALGGKGGAGVSTLTFDDTLSVTQSAVVNATAVAGGGAGGLGVTLGAVAAGTATLVLKGTAEIHANSSATGGAGVLLSGIGTALTTATGVSGDWSSAADASLRPGKVIQSVSGMTSGVVDGTSVGKSLAGIGGKAFAISSVLQGVSFIEGAPLSTSTATVLTGNANIRATFGTAPVIFGMGELGGAHSNAAAGEQTVTSSVTETVDLTQLASRQDLVIGLFKGTTVGTGVTGVTFDLYADGVDVIHQTFTTAAAAKTYFTNHSIDVGSLATGAALGADTLTFTATLSVTSNLTTTSTTTDPTTGVTTTTTTASGFYAQVLFGESTAPAVAPLAANIGTFAQSIAAMGGGAGALSSMMAASRPNAQAMLASPAHFS